jgi:hypothetical protein
VKGFWRFWRGQPDELTRPEVYRALLRHHRMTSPAFDGEGYPTDHTLDAIEHWSRRDIAGCLDFCRAAWHWPEMAHERLTPEELTILHAEPGDRFVRFATGGWSGNESLITALQRNQHIRARAWRLSSRGGLHIYQYV